MYSQQGGLIVVVLWTRFTKMNVQGVFQWSCVKWYMKKLMIPPTTRLESS